jgi:hypothetical protein
MYSTVTIYDPIDPIHVYIVRQAVRSCNGRGMVASIVERDLAQAGIVITAEALDFAGKLAARLAGDEERWGRRLPAL